MAALSLDNFVCVEGKASRLCEPGAAYKSVVAEDDLLTAVISPTAPRQQLQEW